MKTAAAILASLLLLSSPAHAVVFDTTATLDLSKSVIGPVTSFNSGFTPINVDIAEGDTWNFTVDFLGSQTLTVTGLSAVWLLSFANLSSPVEATGTLSFLDVNGNTIFETAPKNDVESAVHLGQYFSGVDLAGISSPITFGGVRYSGKVIDYQQAGVISRTYDSPYLEIRATETVLSTAVSAVPEPATWAMMISGFGLVGGTMRRRKVTVRFA